MREYNAYLAELAQADEAGEETRTKENRTTA